MTTVGGLIRFDLINNHIAILNKYVKRERDQTFTITMGKIDEEKNKEEVERRAFKKEMLQQILELMHKACDHTIDKPKDNQNQVKFS